MDNITGTDVQALSQVLDSLEGAAAEGDKVSVEELVETLGRRSFPALVLAPGLIAVSPASGIPGLTGTIGMIVVLITVQMLFGRSSAWLPGFLTRRRISSDRLRTALGWLRRPVGFVERLTKPRLVLLVSRPLIALPILVMMSIGLIMPLLEFVPTSGSIAGAIISTFAIGLLMRDGLLVFMALCLTVAAPIGIWQIAT
ncbi:MAG: exopolysaccharide biosynthesis protein [Mesorhizobium sp.]|nr:exopolysaccharide biosynthesis protein [Mesorhizobium sp.]